MPDKNERVTANLALTARARDRLRDFCGETRVQRAVLGQLIEWFTDQPAPVQRVVMGEVTEGMEADYAATLERLAAQVRASIKGKGSKR